jgi:hypothetical protein
MFLNRRHDSPPGESVKRYCQRSWSDLPQTDASDRRHGVPATSVQPLDRLEKNLECAASRPDEHGTSNSADRLDSRFDLGQRFG